MSKKSLHTRLFVGKPNSKIQSWFTRASYVVTVESSDLAKGAVTGSGKYRQYSTITIAAIPNTGYDFVRWSDGNTQQIRTTIVTKDISLTAEFTEHITQCTLRVQSNDSKYGLTSGSGTYNKGVQVEIKALPTLSGKFIQWSDGSSEATRIITVESDQTYVAIFEPDYGILTYRPNYNKTT